VLVDVATNAEVEVHVTNDRVINKSDHRMMVAKGIGNLHDGNDRASAKAEMVEKGKSHKGWQPRDEEAKRTFKKHFADKTMSTIDEWTEQMCSKAEEVEHTTAASRWRLRIKESNETVRTARQMLEHLEKTMTIEIKGKAKKKVVDREKVKEFRRIKRSATRTRADAKLTKMAKQEASRTQKNLMQLECNGELTSSRPEWLEDG
jgi:hypothetical protein